MTEAGSEQVRSQPEERFIVGAPVAFGVPGQVVVLPDEARVVVGSPGVSEPGLPALRVTGLSVDGPVGRIVEPLDIELAAGRCLAIVGESGSGKTMVAKALVGLLPEGVVAHGELSFRHSRSETTAATSPRGSQRIRGQEMGSPGAVEVPGAVGEPGVPNAADTMTLDAADMSTLSQRRGRTVALLPQDPFTSLSPVHRCGDQIAWTVAARARGRGEPKPSSAQLADRVTTLLTEVNLDPEVARQYPHELSGGMRQRVALAAAVAADPAVLVADEPTTALDASNRREMLELLRRIQRERALAVVLISHDLGLVSGFADEVLVLYAGHVVETGPTQAVLAGPSHPYTAALRQADPPIDARLSTLGGLAGAVPKPGSVHEGCVFYERCALREDRCRESTPALLERAVPPGVRAACFVTSGPLQLSEPPKATEDESDESENPLLTVNSVSRSFGRTRALSPSSLTVGRGEVVGIAGESGSGKTTLARCVAGLDTPDSGTIVFDGVTLGAKRHPGDIQVVFQDPYSALNPSLTVASALTEATRQAPTSARYSVGELLRMVGLPDSYLARRPRDLSGGERQRVVIARALAPRPRLLICDESVSALDVSVQAQILELLRELTGRLGLSIMFISHDLAVLRQLADRIYVMRHGEIIESGATRQIIDTPQHAYTQQLVAASTISTALNAYSHSADPEPPASAAAVQNAAVSELQRKYSSGSAEPSAGVPTSELSDDMTELHDVAAGPEPSQNESPQ